MVAAVQSLRLCARACSRVPVSRRTALQITNSTRSFSSTRARRADEPDVPTGTEGNAAIQSKSSTPKQPSHPRKRSDKVVLGIQDGMSGEEKKTFREALSQADDNGTTLPARWTTRSSPKEINAQAERMEDYMARVHEFSREEHEAFKDLDDTFSSLEEEVALGSITPRPYKSAFWAYEETDPDYLSAEDMDADDFTENDIMSMAHGKLEEHREFREYARIAAWQMPLLSKLARPFEAPTKQECLRFRFTTYMGESHPAQSKVVVEFSTKDLPLNGKQALKLKKLLGSRWNPETQIAKMSCEQFDYQAQNKRYLGELINKLIAEAKDTTDTFEDVPLETRHHKIVKKPKFPKEWYLTVDRVEQLESQRQSALLLDQGKMDAGSLVDGEQVIERHFKQPEFAMPAHLGAASLSPGRPAPPRQRRFA